MLIRELSRRTGASIRSIRYYEAKGLLVSERRENGYRDYAEEAAERVRRVQLYLGLGMNTDDIARIIDCPVSLQPSRPTCAAAYALYQMKLAEVEKQLEILEKVRQDLTDRILIFERQGAMIERARPETEEKDERD